MNSIPNPYEQTARPAGSPTYVVVCPMPGVGVPGPSASPPLAP